MNVLVRDGYDVWTMDHDGYGYSGCTSGNSSDIPSGVEDLKAADAGGGEGNRPAKSSISTAPRPAASAPRPIAQAQPERVEPANALPLSLTRVDGAAEI